VRPGKGVKGVKGVKTSGYSAGDPLSPARRLTGGGMVGMALVWASASPSPIAMGEGLG